MTCTTSWTLSAPRWHFFGGTDRQRQGIAYETELMSSTRALLEICRTPDFC